LKNYIIFCSLELPLYSFQQIDRRLSDSSSFQLCSKAEKMRGKRSKQYRKLMHRYETSFGFRPPFQVLVDAELVTEAHRCKMDLGHLLKRTLQSDIKPSTCFAISIQALLTSK
jgi:hypothetical protein